MCALNTRMGCMCRFA